MALTPVRKVGSGNGSNKLECSDGRGLPDSLLAFTLAGSIAPSQNASHTARGSLEAVTTLASGGNSPG